MILACVVAVVVGADAFGAVAVAVAVVEVGVLVFAVVALVVRDGVASKLSLNHEFTLIHHHT